MTDWSVVVLGVAQDGGLPHVGCTCPRCAAARSGTRPVEKVSCLGLTDGTRRYLFDATPDLPAQLHALAEVAAGSRGDVDPRRLDGLFLTHAHMGHYLGLAHLGREALDVRGVPVHGTARMCAFLETNAPWDRLILGGSLVPDPRGVVDLGGVTVTAIPVPHRGEYTDTVGYRIDGRESRVLFIPDIDSWAAWDRDVADEVRAVDVAYLDATFWSADELPGRDVSEIPHPFVTDSIERLADVADRVRFLHLNHSNPLWDDPARVTEHGFAVAREGECVGLGPRG